MRLKHLEANSLAFILPHIPSKQSNITHICLEQIWVKIGKISRTFPTHFYSKHFWLRGDSVLIDINRATWTLYPDLLAVIARGQLERLDEKLARKRAINEFYRNALRDLPGIKFMPEAPYGRPNLCLTVILITPEEFGSDRETVRLALEAENIEARPVWKPMHLQPVFKGCRIRGGKVSEDLFNRGLCLPSGTQMTGEDLNRVVNVIKSCYKASQRIF